jgi:hypothetical protein
MKLKLLTAGCLALATLAAAPAYADDDNNGALTGAAGGAATGAIVGGPVGAVVGGAVGLAAGAALDPPSERVVTYVQEQPVPEQRIVVQQQIVVGEPLPAEIALTPIPGDDAYAYTVVNEQRVIVDPRTHTVVKVIE